MSNVTIGNLKTPKKMPESQVQRIKNLTCPPPIMPSKTSKRIQDLLNQIQNQKQEIELLENQVNDLESRYKIFFSVNPQIKYDLKPGQLPRVDISGNSLQNVILEFHMHPAKKGIQGLQGDQGDQGATGMGGVIQGNQGPPGYYGVRGDATK